MFVLLLKYKIGRNNFIITHQVEYSRKQIVFIFLMIAISYSVSGQDSIVQSADTQLVQIDVSDLIRKALHKPPKNKPESAGSLLLVPIIGSNPATGFMYGIGGQYAFKMSGKTSYSSLIGSVQGTTKNQILVLLKNNIYTRNNRLFLTGDWRYLKYSQSTYGLGTTSPEGGILDYQYGLAGLETNNDSLSQPMKFNFIRFHQSFGYKIASGLYAGMGYEYDGFSKIVDEKLRLEPGDTFLTSHYYYNTLYGFNTTNYSLSAITANLSYDTRDNMINPYKGIYVLANWAGGFEFLGNKNYVNYFKLEFRSFYSLSKSRPRHLIAIWAMGDFTKAGQLPYLILPSTAYDQRSRSGRGYTQGRFRGPNLVYTEAEYRFPLGPRGVLGGVMFINGTTTDNPGLKLQLFESIKAGYGAGLRIMVDKRSRTNLAVDVGFGQKSFGFYLAASEAF
jgi:outer membrane protein assembly factor BamA